MRIAIIKSNYTPYGGAEKYTTRLIEAFVKNHVEIDVLTSVHGKWSSANRDFRLIALKQFPYNNLLRLLTFNSSVNAYLRKAQYDCILGMDRTEYQTHLRAGSGCHAAWIQRRCAESSRLRCVSFKANPFHRAMLEIERRAFLSDKLKKIICNSSFVAREILHFYPGVVNKLTVVHNGVEWDEFAEPFEEGPGQRNHVLRKLSLDSDKFYFLFVGSGYERKGLRKAVMALPSLPGHTELIVIGKDKHEDLYKALSKKAGLSKRVHFFGPQRDVIPFLQAADAFVLPTIYDPFSNASLEALAMGLYTVTSEANGCSEVITEGAGAIIANLREIGSVAGAMETALGTHLSKKEIRETVRHLDFETQLRKIGGICIADANEP
jgi:UDP-glucose:(heptosyl)LPS alpha-1,3-glucosyltransferase